MVLIRRVPMEIWLSDPVMIAPPGMHSNFVNPSNLKTEGLILVVFCLTASMFVVAMRMWTKSRLVRKVALEDWVCCLALASLVAMCALILTSLNRGVGVHLWNIRVKDVFAHVQSAQIGRILYCIDFFLIKLAILLQLLRIFVPLRKRDAMFWTCHFLIWLNFCYYTVYIFLIIFDCKPIKKGWSTRVYPPIEGSCLDLNAAYVTGAVINVFSDFSIVILPQFFVWRLQVSLKRKIGLCSIFVIGFLGCASSIVRLYNAVKLTHDRDPLYLAGVQDLWAIVEATCGILAMCLPVSPKFFKSLSDTKLWSILKSSFPSFTRPKTELSRTSETCPDEIKALKLNNGFHSLQATFKKYNYVSVHSIPSVSSPSINPVSSSSIAGSDRAAVRNNS